MIYIKTINELAETNLFSEITNMEWLKLNSISINPSKKLVNQNNDYYKGLLIDENTKYDSKLYEEISYQRWDILYKDSVNFTKKIKDYFIQIGFKINENPSYEYLTYRQRDEDKKFIVIEINCLPDDYYLISANKDKLGIYKTFHCDTFEGLKQCLKDNTIISDKIINESSSRSNLLYTNLSYMEWSKEYHIPPIKIDNRTLNYLLPLNFKIDNREKKDSKYLIYHNFNDINGINGLLIEVSKLPDEYYLVSISNLDMKGTISYHYKCDALEGLKQLIEDKTNLTNKLKVNESKYSQKVINEKKLYEPFKNSFLSKWIDKNGNRYFFLDKEMVTINLLVDQIDWLNEKFTNRWNIAKMFNKELIRILDRDSKSCIDVYQILDDYYCISYATAINTDESGFYIADTFEGVKQFIIDKSF